MPKLPRSFYTRSDVVTISRELLGKLLYTQVDGVLTGGIIVETEAYSGFNDRACHAYSNRRTKRTEVMYGPGGVAYVYLVYGLHTLFNIVTNEAGKADAVLIRAIEPTNGVEEMLLRRSLARPVPQLTAGPGVLSQALGISTRRHYGTDLTGHEIWLEDRGVVVPEEEVVASPRVGIDYAGEDALLPWRFRIGGNRWTSKSR
jgi:DNA-3-methyladenine glycosylase